MDSFEDGPGTWHAYTITHILNYCTMGYDDVAEFRGLYWQELKEQTIYIQYTSATP